ncbi:MAG: TIR domain-containing protein [Coriobacteriia bacterium]|nr:TIR domain-containing protein [Coriobacteriia bacterium]
MATEVVISWSGELSRKLGESLRTWLPAALQYVKPYFSPEDVQKGTKWNTEIATELDASNVGIICLTPDNTEKPWILFEAGALSKSIDKSRVCTLLFNLEPTEVKGPLTNFQATRFVREDFKRLVATINSTAGEAKLEPSVLDSVFEMWWPKLERDVAAILKSHDEVGAGELRSDRDILEEVLELARVNAKGSPRSARMSERALYDLVEGVEEMTFALGGDVDAEAAHHILMRLDWPLRYLCKEAGAHDAYDRYRMRRAELGMRQDLLLTTRRDIRGEIDEDDEVS